MLLSVLRGQQLWSGHRAADMATFQFGAHRETRDFYGRPQTIGDFALHIQCAWRIVSGDRVLVGSRDLYYPAAHHEGESVPGDFDWDTAANRRDRLMAELFSSGRELTVRGVFEGTAGAFALAFDGEARLEVFPDDSLEGERWRLFETREGGQTLIRNQLGGGLP